MSPAKVLHYQSRGQNFNVLNRRIVVEPGSASYLKVPLEPLFPEGSPQTPNLVATLLELILIASHDCYGRCGHCGLCGYRNPRSCYKSPPPEAAHHPNFDHPFSKDNNTANFSRTAVKLEMQPDQSLVTTIVGSISIRVRLTSATVTNFLLGSARSIFLLFLILASLIWILRAYN